MRKGKAYSGRVVLAGSAGAKVSVSLVWGAGRGDRQAVPITTLTAAYAKFPLKFTAAADSDNARIEISGTGQGSFHIGAVSLMPADNIRGFRPDIIALLKGQRSGMWRFPGGNYLSAFEWRDAIGDPDKRPPRLDPGSRRVSAERCRHRRIHDHDRTARRGPVYQRQRRFRRRLVGGAIGGIRQRRGHHSHGTATRGQRPPRALPHQMVGNRQ